MLHLLSIPGIWGSPLTVDEMISHLPRKQPSRNSEMTHKPTSSAYNGKQRYVSTLHFCSHSRERKGVKCGRKPQLNYSLLAPTVCFQPMCLYIYICGHTHIHVHARVHARMQGENVTVNIFTIIRRKEANRRSSLG